MQVEEMLSFDKYWNDPRFQYKKPVINGSLVQLYGDNIYHKDLQTGEWVQDNSAHALVDGIVNEAHLRADIKGERVLISKKFYYFGDESIKIPDEFLSICSEGRSVKSIAIPTRDANAFVSWLSKNYEPGIYGDPINWKNHK